MTQEEHSKFNPPTQYADATNLKARQRLWAHQTPPFDFRGWVISLAAPITGSRVLDVGCGNGDYLRELSARGIDAVGCDLSFGMLRDADCSRVACADVCSLPTPDAIFDVVYAPHMLYHVPDRPAAVRELRRVLAPGAALVAVTNGSGHIASIRQLVETAAAPTNPGWTMSAPAMRAFSLETGADLLSRGFESVECIRPDTPRQLVITQPGVIADYVASVGDYYQPEVACPWPEVVRSVRNQVRQIIERDGAFITLGDVGAFVCR